jgi:hypothetical protein
MQRRSRRAWILVLGALLAVVLVLALGVVWAVAPEEARGLLLLVGGVLTAAVYVALYALQRREHWRS